MLLNAFFDITILATLTSHCACYVGYEMFHGFDTYKDVVNSTQTSQKTTPAAIAHRHVSLNAGPRKSRQGKSTPLPRRSARVSKTTDTEDNSLSMLLTSTMYPKFLCPEDERPFNIGPYEVPTQRDLVLQIQKTLTKMFDTYQERAMDFLQDIQEATKATADIEKKCYNGAHNHQKSYKKCVKLMSKKCEYVIKRIVTSLERKRDDVSAFIEGTICTVREMKADPLLLIKELAMEQASLDFALPGFLRLLGTCSAYCDDRISKKTLKKPLRHMTDQDLVVKHFLTKKSYVQLLKDSK